MVRAAISADIIASSSLTGNEIDALTQRIHSLFELIHNYQKKNGLSEVKLRLVSGDLIECLLYNPQDALRIALILKTGIKSFPLDPIRQDKYRKAFETYGIRVAVGVGDMDLSLVDKNIFKGDAISRSGRTIGNQKTSNKERLIMKNTLFFDSSSERNNQLFNTIMSLLDFVFSKMTTRQSEIILWRILGYSEKDIASEFAITQSSVNQQSRTSGWAAIEDAINLYSGFDFQNMG